MREFDREYKEKRNDHQENAYTKSWESFFKKNSHALVFVKTVLF